MNKNWILIKNRTLPEYLNGVEQFLNFAFSNTEVGTSIQCPCIKCNNVLRKKREEVNAHLLRWGIDPTYNRWIFHGESDSSSDDEIDLSADSDLRNDDASTFEMLHDMYRGVATNIDEFDETVVSGYEEPNSKAKTFYRLLKDAEQKLYPDCERFSKLSFVMRLFQMKCLHGWSNTSFDIVATLLAELRLTHLADTRLGHGLSGGERRRVSIGLSLLHDPAILLLDEPTSGLDSNSALNVMQTLRSIADSRQRTVILSIHQPSFKILATIDKILLLSKGSVVHYGTLFSLEAFLLDNGFTVPPQLNSLEYAMEVLNQLNKKNPITANLLTPSPNNNNPTSSVSETKKNGEVKYKSSRFHEIAVLYSRLWKIIYRTRQLLLTNTLQALIVGLVLGTIYINIGYDKAGIEKRLGLFAFTLTFLLSSTTETLPIFINERPILLRETSSGVYRLSSYLVANTLVFLPYLLVISILYSVSLYFLVGLCATWQAFTYFVLTIWVIVLMANSFVLFLSTVAPNYIAGTSLVTMILAGFFLFSGYFISKENMPKFWALLHYLSMYKYGLDALLINEYSCLVTRCLIWFEDNNKICMVSGRDVLEQRGLHESQRWINIYILVGFFVFYRLLCLMVLIRRVSRSKK